jgi:hypothetical protein
MIVLNNLLVVGALNAIKEKGLMIPQDSNHIGPKTFVKDWRVLRPKIAFDRAV